MASKSSTAPRTAVRRDKLASADRLGADSAESSAGGSRSPLAISPAALRGLRVAFVTRKHPFLEASGSASYIRAILEPLAAAGASIHIVVTEVPDGSGPVRFWRDPSAPVPGAEMQVRKRFRFGPWYVRRPANPIRTAREVKLRLLGPTLPPGSMRWPEWDRSMDAAEIRFAQRCLERIEPDVVIANYSWMAGIWPHRTEQTQDPTLRVILTHDVRHLECREGRIQEKAGYPRARELDELGRGDLLVAIQPREAEWFQGELKGKRVVTVPIGLKPNWPAARKPVPGRCLMVGSNNENNARGLRWFLDYVWPQVLAEAPGATLDICGAVGANPLLTDLPAQVTRRGRVDDLQAEYANAAVVVAPLVAGSGLKIKVVEAFAHGCPAVGTSVALDGIETHHELLAPCDQPETFARRVALLLRDDAARGLAEQAVRQIATDVFSPAACLRPLIERLKERATRS